MLIVLKPSKKRRILISSQNNSGDVSIAKCSYEITLFGFLKESGFVRFAHSILFNFQVPHLRYRKPVCVAVSLTAYLFYHIFFHLSRGFLKFLSEDFQERSALSIFRKAFKVP